MEPEPDKNTPSRRHDSRIAAMQFLYIREVHDNEELSEHMCSFFEDQEEPRKYYTFAEELIEGYAEHAQTVDNEIRKHTKNWAFHRIAKADLAILRLALYELLFRTDIPPIVSINEAIDLAKTFSTSDSKRFINGILDKAKDQLTRPLRAPAQPAQDT